MVSLRATRLSRHRDRSRPPPRGCVVSFRMAVNGQVVEKCGFAISPKQAEKLVRGADDGLGDAGQVYTSILKTEATPVVWRKH